jgi:hypothetical protein
MNETTQQLPFSWFLVFSQAFGILLIIALVAVIALLIRRAMRKKQ